MAAFIDTTVLANALGPTALVAIFDDNRDDVADDAPMQLVIARAHAQVLSWIPPTYHNLPVELPALVPALLADAELNYALAFAWERHPEYMRTDGADSTKAWTRAETTMKNVADTIQRLPDFATQPSTVGGIVFSSGQRLISDNPDGTSNAGAF